MRIVACVFCMATAIAAQPKSMDVALAAALAAFVLAWMELIYGGAENDDYGDL